MAVDFPAAGLGVGEGEVGEPNSMNPAKSNLKGSTDTNADTAAPHSVQFSSTLKVELTFKLDWSGVRESNPFLHLGRVMLSRSTNPASL